MSKKPFDKFIKQELKGSKKKEAIRQQKRKLKEEARQRGEEYRKKEAEKYQAVGTRFGNTPEQRGGKGKQLTIGRSQLTGDQSKVKGQKSKGEQDLPATHSDHRITEAEMPLNKFIAHAGICGRREAADLVKEGKVTVNGDIIYEPGYKVRGNEDVKVNGKKIFSQKNLVYVLLNKPKDYLTTLKDPEGRRTVMDLIKAATRERVYPVGRLDRNTTGVLILTNDGELAQKLTHPSYEIKKIYEVKLDKPVTKTDMEAILNGITLEDGFIKADAVSYADAKDKTVVGIEIHSGRNRIVRRIFEHLGYDVRNLDRVMFANLTKKNVDRGKWRFLNEKEVRLLKFMNQSFIRAKKDRDEKEEKAIEEVLAGDRKKEKPKLRDKEAKEETRSFKPTGERKKVGDDAGKERKRLAKSEDGKKPGATGEKEEKKGFRKVAEGEKKPRKRTYKSNTAGERPAARKSDRSFSDKRTPAKKSNRSFGEKRSSSSYGNRPASSSPAKRSTGRKRS